MYILRRIISILAPRFHQAAELSATARSLGLVQVGSVIANALNADRSDTTINMYRTEVMKFQALKQSPALSTIPSPKARNLYLAKCASEGRQKAFPLITATLNYFCGQLTGQGDPDFHPTGRKEDYPPVQHRAKIDQCSMRMLIFLGTSSTDPKLTQAAALALLQFKAFLRISEARSLRCTDVSNTGNGLWTISLAKSKIDQYGSGARVSIQLEEAEQSILSQYLSSMQNCAFLLESTSTGLPLTISTLNTRLKLLLHAARLDHISITSHSFRGGAATLAINLGTDHVKIMQAWKWKTTKVFRSYISPIPIDLPTDSALVHNIASNYQSIFHPTIIAVHWLLTPV